MDDFSWAQALVTALLTATAALVGILVTHGLSRRRDDLTWLREQRLKSHTDFSSAFRRWSLLMGTTDARVYTQSEAFTNDIGGAVEALGRLELLSSKNAYSAAYHYLHASLRAEGTTEKDHAHWKSVEQEASLSYLYWAKSDIRVEDRMTWWWHPRQ